MKNCVQLPSCLLILQIQLQISALLHIQLLTLLITGFSPLLPPAAESTFQIIFTTKVLAIEENTNDTFHPEFLSTRDISKHCGRKAHLERGREVACISLQITICNCGLILQLTSPTSSAVAKYTQAIVPLLNLKIQLYKLRFRCQAIFRKIAAIGIDEVAHLNTAGKLESNFRHKLGQCRRLKPLKRKDFHGLGSTATEL